MVQSLRDLNIIINHFEKYPLLTKKREDYLLFSQIIILMNQKKHLTLSGLHEILSLKASMNSGRISTLLNIAFPNIIPAIIPKRSDEEILNSIINPY